MAEKGPGTPQKAGRVRDARGRSVMPLDPVAMRVLRQHDVVQADVLRAITNVKGVGITGKERVFLVVGAVAALTVIGLFTAAVITGDISSAPMAKSSSLVFMCSIPWIVWYNIRRARFGKVADAMLEHLRCPHCGYDLRMLPTDEADGATVCPECGCAWKLPHQHAAAETTPGKSAFA